MNRLIGIKPGYPAVIRGDIIQFQDGVAIWDGKKSPSTVVGRTDDKSIYVFLEDGYDEVRVLCPDGLVGWVSKGVMGLNHGAR